MTNIFHHLYKGAEEINTANLIACLKRTGPHKSLLDVGCWDGKNTLIWARAAGAKQLYGLEAVRSASKIANQKHIRTFSARADRDRWPFPPHSFNCVISNQVIEHLSDLDHFFSESSRVLTRGGYLISSTNNLSSWHNIFATLLGWAPFDFSNSSSKAQGIGNPLAVHRGEHDPRGSTWTHKCIYTTRWLSEWGRLYHLELKYVYGAGYYPFPAWLGRLEPTHAAFITLAMQSS